MEGTEAIGLSFTTLGSITDFSVVVTVSVDFLLCFVVFFDALALLFFSLDIGNHFSTL
jgi:hypothetical protein